LDTATANIETHSGSFQVDFTNLRSDTYSQHSRIPQVAFGTAEQDAFRRDLTFNALFYNLNSQRVEDWTRTVRSQTADIHQRLVSGTG